MSNDTARFYVPFAKVKKLDDGRVLVEGTATSDTIDDGGDVITYEASKRAFAAWPGNVREMHQPKAVGRAAEWIPDDTRNAIVLRAYISRGAPDTQEKVLDGTLKGYSVLAKPTERPTFKMVDGKKVRVISAYDLLEVSVVDRGMNPDTNDLAVIAKADGFTGLVEGGAMEKPEETATEKKADEEPAVEEKKAEAKAEKEPEEEEIKPAAKHYSYAEPESDLECAIYCLRGLKSLRMGELAEAEQEPAQVALLDTAIDAVKRFIGEEAMELAEVEMQAVEAPKAVRTLPILRAALAKVATLSTETAEIRKAVGAIIPPPVQPLDIEPLQKAVADQAQATQKAIGELASGLKAVGEGVAKILAAPVPGGPVRMGAFQKGHVLNADDTPNPLGVLDDLIAKASGDPALTGWLRVQKAREEARHGVALPRT